jgi:glucose-6-phosphate dehydrogenase assembly protein OpcA
MNKEATDSLGPRSPWAGKAVHLEEVEQELSSLWRLSADNMRTGQSTGVRTSVLNLVICATDVESAKRASGLLRSLANTHLGRVTVLILDDSEKFPAAISTWVTLRCFSMFSDLMRHCFEQITMIATGSATRAAANILQPLLKPELPVYLWWLGDPPASSAAYFSDLVQLSSRVIVDSTSFLNPEQDLLTLANIYQSFSDCAISDLNWGRLTPWRQLVAQFFDVMDYRPYLDGVSSIEIEHAAEPFALQTRTEEGDVSPNPACALLLAGWLKGILGWSIPDDPTSIQRDTNSGTYFWQLDRISNPRVTRSLGPTRGRSGKLATATRPSISIRPQIQSHMRPGSICLVRLTSTVEGKQATFTIDREGDPDHVLTSVDLSHGTHPQRTVNLTSEAKATQLFNDELEIIGHDLLYEQALQEVADLLT